MKKHLLLIIALASIFSVNGFAASAEFEAYKRSCLSPAGGSFIAEVESGITMKPDAAELKVKLGKLARAPFCDCLFSEFEKAFGADRYVQIRSPDYATKDPVQKINEMNQIQKIHFTCFGKLVGRPDLTPPGKADLASVVANAPPKAMNPWKQAKDTTNTIRRLMSTIELFKSDHGGKLPVSVADLVPPGGSYATAKDLKDGWGNEISMQWTGSGYRIFSNGPDGKAGTADDIVQEAKWFYLKTRGMSDRVTIELQDLILTKGITHARRAVYHPDSGDQNRTILGSYTSDLS
jgi:hypothetical protein